MYFDNVTTIEDLKKAYKKWYWMPIDKRHRRYYRGDTSMEDIRDKYGSISFNKKGKEKEQITA